MQEGGISARKAGQMWELSMEKLTLTRVKLNRRVTFDRRIEVPSPVFIIIIIIFLILTKNEEKNGLQMG